MNLFMNRLAWAGAISLVGLSTANAHMTLETGTAAAGSSYKAVVRVPHGCDGAATTEIRVKVPEGYYSVKPMPHAGWTLETVNGPYAETYMNHGTPVSEGVTEVVWTGGNLPDAFYDEFVMSGSLSADIAPETVLTFPTEQLCADGSANHWTGEDGGEPAPKLIVTAVADNDAHASHGEMAHDMDHAMPNGITVGDLDITGAFARATLPGAPVGGGFLTITNKGETNDRLVAASSDAAGDLQLHNMRMDGDVMKMYQMTDGVPVPAHESVTLAPGGMHVMFMQLNGPMVEGSTVDVELTFEKAGTVIVPFPVRGIAAKDAGPEAGMNHGNMDHGQ
ncbi:DUF1775 domain-containing protein [Martelella endophytica]|uniref:Signal peptide protein n=1 Tax=Martelella endophytica TaxID=1486262 RepID=A0A0D5LJV0_MAREN|nr:DUF1775 domain-containing protein [Martelella endophytica]AJY44464.1 signal peptide protein [Martelella endophytica]